MTLQVFHKCPAQEILFYRWSSKASAGLLPAKDWPRCRSEKPVPERDEGCPQGLEVIESASTGRESRAVLQRPLFEERTCQGWQSGPKRQQGLAPPLLGH